MSAFCTEVGLGVPPECSGSQGDAQSGARPPAVPCPRRGLASWTHAARPRAAGLELPGHCSGPGHAPTLPLELGNPLKHPRFPSCSVMALLPRIFKGNFHFYHVFHLRTKGYFFQGKVRLFICTVSFRFQGILPDSRLLGVSRTIRAALICLPVPSGIDSSPSWSLSLNFSGLQWSSSWPLCTAVPSSNSRLQTVSVSRH